MQTKPNEAIASSASPHDQERGILDKVCSLLAKGSDVLAMKSWPILAGALNAMSYRRFFISGVAFATAVVAAVWSGPAAACPHPGGGMPCDLNRLPGWHKQIKKLPFPGEPTIVSRAPPHIVNPMTKPAFGPPKPMPVLRIR